MEVSTADLAEILNLTERRIQQLAASGVFRRHGHGEWILPECVQAFVEHKVQHETAKAKKCAGAGNDRLKDVKARREELKLAAEERELVPLADAIFVIDELAGTVALEVNNLPARITRDIDERERLKVETDAVLHAVADRAAKCCAALRANRDADPPAEEDDAGSVGS